MNKILLIGETDNENSSTIEIMNSFQNIGYKVDSFNFRSISFELCKFKFLYKYLDFIFKKLNRLGFKYFYYNFLGRAKMLQILLNLKFDEYNFVLFTKCEFINPIIFLKINKIAPVYYFFFDSMLEIRNYDLYNHFNFSKKAFVVSKTMSQKLTAHKKIKRIISYCPQGISSHKWNKEKKNIKNFDVVFIGSKNEYRNKFINFLKTNGINVLCYGIGFENGEIYNDKLNLLYQKSKIALNFSRDKISYSIRIYQIMASGCFVLSTETDELSAIFNKGEHFDDFDSKEKCLEKIKYYLKNSNILSKLTDNSYIKVHDEFNWERICKKFIIDNED